VGIPETNERLADAKAGIIASLMLGASEVQTSLWRFTLDRC
jgi:hypothetical protein